MSSATLGPRAGRLPLVGGALALDFCNTTSGIGSAHCLEHLGEFEHLVLWSAHAGALTSVEAEAVRALARREPDAGRAALDEALGLRLTLHDLFRALAHGGIAPPANLKLLNTALAAGAHGSNLVQTANGFCWHYPSPDRTLNGMLGPIARSAAEVLLTVPIDRIKQCPGNDCGWVFLDRSKNGIRVWCEMEVCGARAKARLRAERRRKA